jgi:glycosyltransferase involved in cell wall biosynthesis
MDQDLRSIKILHVTGAMNRAGTETFLMNIFRNLCKDHVQFDFISYHSKEADYDNEITKMGGNIFRLAHSYSIIELYRIMKKNGPYDAVHAHTLFHCGLIMIIAWIAGVRTRISHAHTTFDNNYGLIRKIYIFIMKKMIGIFSTHLLACSTEAAKYLFGEKVLTKNKYYYFPNLIEYKKFLNEPKKDVETFKTKNNLNDSIVIGHIGRFIKSKNHEFILEIYKHILKKELNCKLLLVGTGDHYEKIKEIAIQEGFENKIVFAGVREDIHTMLHSMDIFLFPSIYEGLGLVLLEAQAAGVPCLVSEAIQPEADLGIGLVHRNSLKESAEIWAAHSLDLAGKKLKNNKKKIRGFLKNGYDIDLGLHKLVSIYMSKSGRKNEESNNCLIRYGSWWS